MRSDRGSELRFAEANGIRIAYDAFGEPEAPPLLLIMGLGSQMILWDESFCRQLAAQGYRVIRFDNRDIGLSGHLNDQAVPDAVEIAAALQRGKPPGVPYTLYDMAADTAGLLGVLGYESAHVVGESMGGMIAQIMAVRFPECLRTLTAIMSSTGDPMLPPPKPEVLEILFSPFPTDRHGYIDSFVNAFRVLNGSGWPVDEPLVVKWAAQSFDRGLNPAGVARQYAAMLATGDRTAELKTVAAPTLVIHGDADPLLPIECGRAIAKAVPGARFTAIAGMGHALPPAVWPQVIGEIARHAR